MAAVLKIRIDNEATASLQALEQQLQSTAEVTAEQAVETRVLTDAQKEQIKVIHEHRAAFSQLAATLGPLMIHTAHHAAALGLAYWQYRKSADAAAIATRVVGTAAKATIGAVTGLGPVLAGAALGAKGLEVALANTGIEIKQLKVDSDEHRAATEDQRKAFERLRIEVARSGVEFATYAQTHREELESLGVLVTSNLDRTSKAAGKLGKDLVGPFRDGITYTREWLGSLTIFEDAWKTFDKRVTQGSKNFEQNADAIRKGWRSITDAASGAYSVALFGGESVEATAKELKAYRELADAQEKFAKRQKETVDDFSRLRSVSEGFEKSQKEASERRKLDRVSELSEDEKRFLTNEQQTAALLSRIDGEMARRRSLAGQKAAANQLDETEQRKLATVLESLETRRTSIIEAQEERRNELRKASREETEKREKESIERRARDENAAILESIKKYNDWAKEVREAQQRVNDFAREYANNANNEILEITIERLESEEGREEEAHRAKQDLIQQEIDQRIAAADTVEEREQAYYDGLLRMQREQLQHQRAAITAEIDARKEAAAKAVEIEKKKQDAIKQALQDAGMADGRQMLQQIDPRRALMDQRGKTAADAARKAVLNDPDNQQLRQQALVDVAASRRLRGMQERAAREAERSARAGAYRDFRRGDVDPAELAKAQSESGKQLLQNLQKNGQLSGDTVQVLQETLQAAANQQAVTDGLQRQLDQMKPAVKAMLANSAQQRQRATKGGLN